MSGILFVVATPIGNMSDISPRAVETLKLVDYIIAEDTRTTGKLLGLIGIKNKMFSYHKFNEKSSLEKHVKTLKEGKNIAMVSDAGTPAVSDPGKHLVRAVLENGLSVIPIPGPSAAAAAFSCSGSLNDSYLFAGFLPSKGKVREEKLDSLLSTKMPVIFYESPNRIKNLLKMLEQKKCRIVVARELTKQFEEVFVYSGREIVEKGEFSVVVEPPEEEKTTFHVDPETLDIIKKYSMSSKDALTLASKIYPKMSKNDIKREILSARNS